MSTSIVPDTLPCSAQEPSLPIGKIPSRRFLNMPLDNIASGHILDIRSVSRILPATESIYTPSQKHLIQTFAICTSAFTILAALITFYFFSRMKRRLRHKLVMLSILGCFIRGMWYFAFSAMVISGKIVTTQNSFCQATGFFIHIGNEMSDIATLLIALHGALQIFRPSVSQNLDLGDGLHDYRRYCFAAAIVVPIIMASITFTNPGHAYTSQGAFCTLPTSPIWYRLFLSWVPRYIIMATAIVLSIAVYVHVELKFRSFAASQRASRTSIAFPSHTAQVAHAMTFRNSLPDPVTPRTEVPRPRRASLPTLRTPDFETRNSQLPSRSASPSQDPFATSHDQPGSATQRDYFSSLETPPFMPTAASASRKVSIATTESRDTGTSSTKKSRGSLPGAANATLKRTHSAIQKLAAHHNNHAMVTELTAHERQAAERKVLRRQLRLIFVYPIVYVLLWLPPTILFGLQLLDKFSSKVPPQLGILSNGCLTLMGGIDCLVFLWREKPWRRAKHRSRKRGVHSSSTCRTFEHDMEKGSGEEHATAPADDSIAAGCQQLSNDNTWVEMVGCHLSKALASLRSPFRAMTPLRSSVASSSLARQRALERLGLEIEDRREATRTSMGTLEPRSTIEEGGQAIDSRSGKKEWWDRHDSISTW